MHEAVLPQTAREMLANRDWIVPQSGGRPWLERPPLPQWVTVAIASAVGRCDAVWIVRLGNVVAATLAVLLTAGTAARLFGSFPGLLAGLLTATLFEFVSYAWLCEQDIFLCALVVAVEATFVRLCITNVNPQPGDYRFWGRRSAADGLFFVLLGLTHLVKGLGFGPGFALAPIVGFGWLDRGYRHLWLRRLAWGWGWLVTLLVAIAWPIAAWQRYPEVIDLWLFDHVGRLDGAYTAINQPWWYYFRELPALLAPWTPLALVGLAGVLGGRDRLEGRGERFLACWAVVPMLGLSFASGKHHHYLLHSMPAWGMLAALPLHRLLQWTAGRAKARRGGARLPRAAFFIGICGGLLVLAAGDTLPGSDVWSLYLALACVVSAFLLFCGLASPGPGRQALAAVVPVALVYVWIHSCVLPLRDQTLGDTEFLQEVARRYAPGQPLLVNGDIGSMDMFRIQFYLDAQAELLHNLTFLRDARRQANEVLLITRASDRDKLDQYGMAEPLLQSTRSRREQSPRDRLTLFRLRLSPDLVRVDGAVRVTPMQSMGREEGPYLEPRGVRLSARVDHDGVSKRQ